MNTCNTLTESLFKQIELEKNKKNINIEIKESTLFFVLSGSLAMSYDGIVGKEIKGGYFFLIQANSSLQFQIREKAKLILCPFLLSNHFSERLTLELFDPYSKKHTIELPFKGRLNDFLILLSGYLDDNIDAEDLYILFRQGLFILFESYYSKEELSNFFAPVIGEDIVFKDFILKNCLHTESLEELASLANYSISGFEKKFRRCFYESPYKWILRHKAKRILQEIQISNKPFKEIAEEYSFSSQSYFYTFCRKHYGSSPREIRKESKPLLKKRAKQ